MNKTSFTLLIAILLLFTVKSAYTQQTKWQSDKYNNLEELSKLEFLYDNQGKIFYLLTNDKENLYIHIIANDDAAQKKIIIYGFNIEIKTRGSNKKNIKIEYPLPKEERMKPVILLPDNTSKNRNNFDLTKSQIVKQIVEMRITGLTDKKSSVTISANNKTNINGNMKIYKNGDLQYSLIIPLKSIGVDLSANMPIKIKMTSGSLDFSGPSSMGAGGMGGKGMGGGGHSQGMGGGQHGGGRGQGTGSRGNSPDNMRQKMLEKQALTTPIKITLKKLMLIKENN